MDWCNIYITGKQGFKKEVARRLEHSKLPHMPGYIGNSSDTCEYDMYWISKNTSLRDFKMAVGAKTIWKYRIRTYQSLEEFITSQEKETSSFSDNDLALIKEMRKSA